MISLTMNDVKNNTEKKIKTKTNKHSSWLYWLIIPAILAVITFLFYLPSLNYAFQFDDEPNILKFFAIRHAKFKNLFCIHSRWVSYWLNTISYSIAEFKPYIYRLFNISFHITTGLLVYYFFRLLLSNLKQESFFKKYASEISIITSMLFLLHPVQTQTVSYVVQGQLEGLASLIVMSILVSYVLFTKTKNFALKTFLFALVSIFAFISTGTKEIAIVSPFLVMLTDWFFIAQGDWSSYKKRIPLHIAILALVFGMYMYFLKPTYFANVFGFKLHACNNIGNLLTKNYEENITPWSFCISQFKVILHYLFMFVWPFNISVEYDWKIINNFDSSACLIPLSILIGICGFIAYLLKRNKINPIAFGLLWFFICVAPRSSIIPSSELLADYKTYLASIGWLFIISCAIIYLFNKLTENIEQNKETTFFIFMFLTCLSLGYLTYSRNLVWRSSLNFWENIIDNAPLKARAYNNYGVELSKVQRYKEAIPYYKKAIKMEGTHYWDPYINLAAAYAIIGKMSQAISTLQEALKLNPYQPEAYNNLGAFLLHIGDFDAAEKALSAAIAMVPHYGRAYYNMGRVYLAKGNLEYAWQNFKKACTQADLDHELTALEPYADLSVKLGKLEDAIFANKRIVEITPNETTKFNLANSYFMIKDFDKAIDIYEHLIKIQTKNPMIYCNLSEAYLITNQAQKALSLLEDAESKNIKFPGMEVQRARFYEKTGQVNKAIKLLENYINNADSEQLRKIAKTILDEIKKRHKLV